MKIKDYTDIKTLIMNNKDLQHYKNSIIEKEDISVKYGYLIFDVENENKNKTLHAIAMADNLGKDYHETCKWLVSNTKYYPGTMNLYLKMFIIIKKINLTLVFPHDKQYTILFEYIENKEDDKILCKSLKFKNDKFQIQNIYYASLYYLDMPKLFNQFKEYHEQSLNSLTITTTYLV